MRHLPLLMIIWLCYSCASNPEIKPLQSAPRGDTFSRSGEYRLGANDSIEIKVAGQEDLHGNYIISQAGTISLPLIGTLLARGLTEKQLANTIRLKLAPYIKNPLVNLSITNYESYKVFISGAVKNPGVFIFKEPTTILQAIAAAGGLSDFSKGELLVHRQNDKKIDKYGAEYEDILNGVDHLNGFLLERGDVIYVK